MNAAAYRRMTPSARVYLPGHRGLVGSAILRCLELAGYTNILTATSRELDLRQQQATDQFFRDHRPDFVILAAAKVGGIYANNTYRADFIRDNLQIQGNVIDTAYRYGVQRLLFLGSSCIYPRDCPQPIVEECLLSGKLETTNEPYAIAKIAGLKMCEAYNAQYGTHYLSVMPTNIFGPGDNFDLQTSHVLPAMIRRFHEAKQSGAASLTIWGTGTPRREFLFVDDLADALVFLLEETDETRVLNIGVGKDISIADLAQVVADVIGYTGAILQDPTKPDGTPRKLLDIARLTSLGWRPTMALRDGIESTYRWYVDNI